ncbi:tyrosine-type recombinase/integrase [Variovorax sp. PBL-E5]|uniref:tyrosine-type recombinase/integrase n=1 Tax=Variovorax sp. PBL-E5 TaxID=434014 RepID=UPI001316AA8E|nr:integrase arm-type DNA-binding domain-containing protein [Variovorax sp. PBL-E5]VTU36245.1 Prophage CP4-57 integrase [Variovorax sp. PBL-E5]
MPKKAAELGALQVNRLTKPGAHAVGGVAGLQLKINDAGARSWVLRAMVAGKRRDMGLGGFPDVPLADARQKAREARSKIDAGQDPIQERQATRSASAAARARAKTFAQCVEAFMKAKSGEWKNAKHRAQWQSTLDTHCAPIGNVLVKDIDLAQVLTVLEPIWQTTTETASRLRGRIETVLDWATARGYRTGDNPARWRGHLDQLLAKPRKIKKVKHQPALKVDDAGSFMVALRKVEGMSARALELAMLAAARSGEVRGARWPEIDLQAKVWTVPAERMKAKKEHRVALSKQAVTLLKALPKIEGTDLLFPGRKVEQPLSDMSLTACMRRMGFRDAEGRMCVPHGCRSTFRDWAAERTNYPREMAEMALAHTIESAVEAAYRRGDLLAKRAAMMQAWADFCDKPRPPR